MVIGTQNLTKFYGKRKVLDDVSVEVSPGRIYGLVGRNGAGKTTLLRVIMGLTPPSGGNFSLFGSSDRVGLNNARTKAGCILETPAVYPHKNAYENMRMAGIIKGTEDWTAVFERLGLAKFGNKKAKNLSMGMKQRLSIAMAMVGKPELLILDEPLNGLDPPSIFEVNEIIRGLNADGVTVIISSHILSELSRTATDVIFIEEGRILKQAAMAELGENLEDYYMDLLKKEGVL